MQEQDWYEALHPGRRAKAEKPKPVAAQLAELFKAQYPEAAELAAAAKAA